LFLNLHRLHSETSPTKGQFQMGVFSGSFEIFKDPEDF
jgi:hypothetical protein